MVDYNAIGSRGESIFSTRISQYLLFRCYFLGDKAPVEDFVLEINDEATPYQCLVQIKATDSPKIYKGHINTPIKREKVALLAKRPLPTYAAGIDIQTEKVYLCSIFKDKPVSSIPISITLDFANPVKTKDNLLLLKQDIIDYWNATGVLTKKNTIKSNL